jgi:hypothetical protein
MNSYDQMCKEGVERGARELDDIQPEWFEKINFKSLVMMDERRCIAGQLGLNWEDLLTPEFCGAFASPQSVPFWEEEVKKRKGAPVKVTKKVREKVLA